MKPLPTLLALALVSAACHTSPPLDGVAWAPRAEVVPDFSAWVPDDGLPAPRSEPARLLERVSTGVPWPRGLAWVDGELVVLARGRHRNAGGVDPRIPDRTGTLFTVDPAVHEPVVPGRLASAPVMNNARLLARPDPDVFHLPDTSVAPIDDHGMDRPYCTLIWDEASRSFFVCGFSGVDLPGRRFRKNATDSIHRFDLRTARWYPVELHDPTGVSDGGWVVSNAAYPHHDPARHGAPHGWLNGPDGGCVAGDFLYCVGKDNHLVVQYDLAGVRADPQTRWPESRPVLGPHLCVSHPGGTETMELLGPSAAVARDGWLYLGYRTSSVVVRLPLEPDGDLVAGAPAELIAVFEPWDADTGRSANLIDLAFNSKGELFVSCAKEGRIWNVGVPDPAHPFLGNDRLERPTTAEPYVDLAQWTGKKTGCGNILFDPEDRLYICSGNYDSAETELAGVIYRALPPGS